MEHPIMPEAAHEIAAILLLNIDGQVSVIGNVREDPSNLPHVLVRLGTKVSDSHPSCVGFRVWLRTDKPKSGESYTIDDYYHTVSCRFEPKAGSMAWAEASNNDIQDLVQFHPLRDSIKVDLPPGNDQGIYRMNFMTADTNAFDVTRHGPDPSTKAIDIRKIGKLLPSIAYASQISLVFIADKLLVKHLNQAIKHNCVGTVAPSWKTPLPDSMVPKWPSDVQNQMVAGSIDILNTLLSTSREQSLRDGPNTSITERAEAVLFRDHIRKAYPSVRPEPAHKVHPVLLNVVDGLCVELPFGASMLNRSNTYASINALHKLLEAKISASRVGIVTLYPAQMEAYQDGLKRCHDLKPERGYNLVEVGLLEHWVDRNVGIAIVDLVRTPNASGNFGFLSQSNRLKALLSTHQNGLIIVGDQTCMKPAIWTGTNTKLRKVLQWLADNGRIANISNKGTLLSGPLGGSGPGKDATGSRRYVGIPGLEHKTVHRILEQGNDTNDLLTSKHSPAALESFKRQGFHPSEPRTSQHHGQQTLDKSIAPRGLAHSAQKQGLAAGNEALTSTKPASTHATDVVSSRATVTNPTETPASSIKATAKSKEMAAIESMLQIYKSQYGLDAYKALCAEYNVEPDLSNVMVSESPSTLPSSQSPDASKKDLHLTTNIKTEAHSPSRPPSAKTPPHKQGPKGPKRSIVPNEGRTLIKNDENAKVSTSIKDNAAPSLKPAKDVGISVRTLNDADQGDFKAVYQPKYKAIRSTFAKMEHKGNLSGEDHLFRQLADAYMDEDTRAFDQAYAELLGLARGLQLGAQRST